MSEDLGSIPVDFSEDDEDREAIFARKRALRAEVRRVIGELDAATLAEKSRRVCAGVMELDEYAPARSLAAYCALADEVDLGTLIEDAVSCGKDVVLPVTDVSAHTMTFISVENPACDLREGAMGILEPRRGMALADPSRLSMVLVPGRAFDSEGGRLGRGGGYYDAFLSGLKPMKLGGPPKVGVCFAEQLVDAVPGEIRDIRMDAIVSDRGVVWVGSG